MPQSEKVALIATDLTQFKVDSEAHAGTRRICLRGIKDALTGYSLAKQPFSMADYRLNSNAAAPG
jgi:hypothetical protein